MATEQAERTLATGRKTQERADHPVPPPHKYWLRLQQFYRAVGNDKLARLLELDEERYHRIYGDEAVGGEQPE